MSIPRRLRGPPRSQPRPPVRFLRALSGNSPYYYDSGRGSQIAITQKVISGVYPGVTTNELDTLAAETAAALTIKHPDYAILGARIAVSNLHKETKKDFSGSCDSRGLFAYPAGRPMPRTAREHTGRVVQAGGAGGAGGRVVTALASSCGLSAPPIELRCSRPELPSSFPPLELPLANPLHGLPLSLSLVPPNLYPRSQRSQM